MPSQAVYSLPRVLAHSEPYVVDVAIRATGSAVPERHGLVAS